MRLALSLLDIRQQRTKRLPLREVDWLLRLSPGTKYTRSVKTGIDSIISSREHSD